MDSKEIYKRMVSSGLNDIVGAGDPEAVGLSNVEMIEKLSAIKPGMRVLDFGCGCGRVALPMLERLGPSGSLVGIDIIPNMIDFCREEISPQYPNAEFYQLQAKNSHYKSWTKNQLGDSHTITSLSDMEDSSFDLVFAFSVFTHLDLADTTAYLNQIASLLKPGGKAILSALFINHSSRMGHKLKTSSIPFGPGIFLRKAIYFGTLRDKLATVGFRESKFIELSVGAGFDVCQIYYGNWPGRGGRSSAQDIISLQLKPKLTSDFDAVNYIKKYSDLPFDPKTKKGRNQAVRHFLTHGYYEGRSSQSE